MNIVDLDLKYIHPLALSLSYFLFVFSCTIYASKNNGTDLLLTAAGSYSFSFSRFCSVDQVTMQQQQYFIVSFVFGSIVAASLAASIHYDQRQDGKLNVHATLENLVFIITGNSDTSSSSPSSPPSSQEPDLAEFSLSGLLDAFELRKNLLAKNKLEHKSEKKNIEAIFEVAQDQQQINGEDYSKEMRSLKIKPEKKKATDVTELTLIGDSIENCGPGRFRDRSGICQFDGSLRN